MSNTKQTNGIGFFGLLAVLFIGLKLTGYIGWSWVWVLTPLWIIPVIVLFLATAIAWFDKEDRGIAITLTVFSGLVIVLIGWLG